jgi:Putative polyhydroxyalkanoic acid system protein (PHA_gran_rgn)
MTTPITITIPHQLGRAEARRRIDTGFASMVAQLPGGNGTHTEHWEADRLSFSVAGMGQTISGDVEVLDAAVTMRIELPGVLGLIANGLRGRLQKAGQLLLTRK